jgi:hypothetical protein
MAWHRRLDASTELPVRVKDDAGLRRENFHLITADVRRTLATNDKPQARSLQLIDNVRCLGVFCIVIEDFADV